MVALSTTAITAIVGILGIVFGTFLSPYLNHLLNLKNTRRDLMFKRKLEYFEHLSEKLEQNIRMYRNAISDIETAKKNNQIISKLKENRKCYLILASPLYFNINNLSMKINQFVDIEKNIFKSISKQKDKIEIQELKHYMERLINSRNEVLKEMRKELYRR
ncbi:MAG: hypothetical protein WC438_02280 [Candidatus Pacearchaeota archaeon]